MDARLQKLFNYYNRKYWNGLLPQYKLDARDMSGEGCAGLCNYLQRSIYIDPAGHSDRSIKATLLHEMAHAAAPGCWPDHGREFWQQLEMLLEKGAPCEIGFPEAPDLRSLADAVPPELPLCRKAAEKAEARRVRSILARCKAAKIKAESIHTITEDEILLRFENAAFELTWQPAFWAVGNEYLLLDVDGQPKNEYAEKIIAKGRRVFDKTRRDHLDSERRWRLRGQDEVLK